MSTYDLACGKCEEILPRFTTGSIEHCITDPPFGINIANNPFRQKFEPDDWDEEPMSSKALEEILRVSRNQIIWGGNYFPLPPTRCFLVWNKKQAFEFSSAMCEMAWTSFDRPAKLFDWFAANGEKLHPTQKPLALMDWCVENYTSPGDTVIDPYMGSGTTGVSCMRLGRNFIGIEISEQYFDIAKRRIEEAERQMLLPLNF